MPRPIAPLTCLLLAASVVTSCSSGTPQARPSVTPSTTPSTSPPTSPAATPTTARPTATRSPAATVTGADCSSYRGADPNRPVLTAEVTVAGRTVIGTQRLVFTPDLPVSELVFRLWASAPRPSAAGGSSALTSVAINGATRTYSRPVPTLVRIPWRGGAGSPVTVDLGFRITLPIGADDRFGSRATTSWFASGLPLLAWERGRGWAPSRRPLSSPRPAPARRCGSPG